MGLETILGAAGGSLPGTKDFMNITLGQLGNLQSGLYSRRLYERQKRDSIEFWGMQNAYNSPAEQMKRFQQAGLNPNLIYGRGDSGSATPVNLPDTAPVNFREGRVEGESRAMDSLLASADLRIKNAQARNLESQATVIEQEGRLRALQARRLDFDLGFDTEMRDVSADYRRESLRQLTTSIDLSIRKDARDAVALSTTVQEAAERMLTMRSERTLIPYKKGVMTAEVQRSNEQIRQWLLDGKLKELDIALREQGINPTDPTWMRIVGQLLSNVRDSGVIDDVIQSVKKGYRPPTSPRSPWDGAGY